jgi:hypothetical protein
MQMHDARAYLAQDGAKTFRCDLVRYTIGERQPPARVDCEAVNS